MFSIVLKFFIICSYTYNHFWTQNSEAMQDQIIDRYPAVRGVDDIKLRYDLNHKLYFFNSFYCWHTLNVFFVNIMQIDEYNFWRNSLTCTLIYIQTSTDKITFKAAAVILTCYTAKRSKVSQNGTDIGNFVQEQCLIFNGSSYLEFFHTSLSRFFFEWSEIYFPVFFLTPTEFCHSISSLNYSLTRPSQWLEWTFVSSCRFIKNSRCFSNSEIYSNFILK